MVRALVGKAGDLRSVSSTHVKGRCTPVTLVVGDKDRQILEVHRPGNLSFMVKTDPDSKQIEWTKITRDSRHPPVTSACTRRVCISAYSYGHALYHTYPPHKQKTLKGSLIL